MIIKRVIPVFAVLLLALSGCTTTRVVLDRTPSAYGEGNGGTRGGGDRVAGEFMEYERIALAKMEAWSKQGKIKIREEDLEKIRAIMPPNQGKNPKHVVTSEDHVCLTEGKRPNGECLRSVDERDVIKQPFAKPPRARVGRKRWDDPRNTPEMKLRMAAHELRGLALSKPGQEFADEDFSDTYAALAAANREWNALVRTHLDFMRRIRVYDEMLELVDLSHFQTVTDTFVKSSSDYSRCVNASDEEYAELGKVQAKLAKKIRKAARNESLFKNLRRIEEAESDLNDTDVKQACDRALEQYGAALSDSVFVIQKQVDQINAKVVGVASEWEAWMNTVRVPAWRSWLAGTANSYIARRKTVQNSAADETNDADYPRLGELLDKQCPRIEKPDFRKVAVCYAHAGAPASSTVFKARMSKLVDQLIDVHEKTVDEVASQVDPL